MYLLQNYPKQKMCLEYCDLQSLNPLLNSSRFFLFLWAYRSLLKNSKGTFIKISKEQTVAVKLCTNKLALSFRKHALCLPFFVADFKIISWDFLLHLVIMASFWHNYDVIMTSQWHQNQHFYIILFLVIEPSTWFILFFIL